MEKSICDPRPAPPPPPKKKNPNRYLVFAWIALQTHNPIVHLIQLMPSTQFMCERGDGNEFRQFDDDGDDDDS